MTDTLDLTPWHITSQLLSEQMPVIDLRSSSNYQRGHLIGASHFPIDTLIERLSELPSRHQVVSLLGTEKQLMQAKQLLVLKGYQIKYQILACDSLFQQLAHKGWLEIGEGSRRLWQPAPVVKLFVEQYSQSVDAKKGLDLACGAGRDSLYLAQQGWQMSAIDYSQSALDKLQRLCGGLNLKVDTQKRDLEKHFADLLDQGNRFDLVLVVRYLHRPLLNQLPLLLNPHGILVYQTFMQGCEAFGSPKNPRFLLRRGELAEVFKNFKILYDQQENLADGRPTNAFIAQKVD